MICEGRKRDFYHKKRCCRENHFLKQVRQNDRKDSLYCGLRGRKNPKLSLKTIKFQLRGLQYGQEQYIVLL